MPQRFLSIVRLGFDAFRRDRGATSAFVVFTAAFLLAHFLLLLRVGIGAGERMLLAEADIHVDVRTSAASGSVQAFEDAVRGLPSVSLVTKLTRDQQLERARLRDGELAAFLEAFALNNPFSDAFVVRLQSVDAYPDFLRFLQDPVWEPVIDPSFLSAVTTQEQEVRDLLAVTGSARGVVHAMLGLVLFLIVLLVWAVVWQRTDGRGEFSIPLAPGARPLAFALPFIAEQTVLLLCALLLSTVIFVLLLPILPFLLPGLSSGGALTLLRVEATPMLLQSILLSVFVFGILSPVLAFLGTLPALSGPSSR